MTVPPLIKAVQSGDDRKSLIAIRDVLAKRLDEAEPRESAAIARQLVDVIGRIRMLPGEEKSDLDDLADRRKKRRAAVS